MTTKPKKTNKGKRVLFLRDLETGLQARFKAAAWDAGLTQTRAFYGLIRAYCEDPGEFPVKKRDKAAGPEAYADRVFFADLPPAAVAVFKGRAAGRGHSMREVGEALMREFVARPAELAAVAGRYSVDSRTYRRI